ncbi:MAG: Mth938-like domain-containing protein [Candidatus Thorarchaeota archaeon]
MQIIEQYSFGKIRISGKSFSNDVIIFPDEVIPSWWRKEGHNLHMEDLDDVIERKPELLIIGTGFNGVMRVSQDLINQLEELGINTTVMKSTDAVKEYNKLIKEKKRIAAGLHLTC